MTQEHPHRTVLLLGGTGRVGKPTLHALLARSHAVRAIVRSVPTDFPTSNANLTVIQASITDLTATQLAEHLRGCDTVVVTLGHPRTAAAARATPGQLVTSTVQKIFAAAAEIKPASPIRLVHLSSHLGLAVVGDAKRGFGEKILLCTMQAILPPFKDTLACAEYLRDAAPKEFVEWVAVRPANYVEGVETVGEFEVEDSRRGELGLMGSGVTVPTVAVGEFLATLVTDDAVFGKWKGKWPVIYDPATIKEAGGKKKKGNEEKDELKSSEPTAVAGTA
ncbi:hypothetical protein AMAG_07473 [Allomyces macrogynus ATCC 38327]|uniref:NAD(P)-binding domain-containing protein n=1 Tax=Allomyces macrogynus (strain ATCC 38327) TaxID=578462 RepID=A0A0L0SIF9_ALLM3|nr:hypothetical protein AMAG_07473 [Allomyces macrogynus ATCC 38327]|eukprot:KNE62234.1 hypothetical protein AMAG_07473 [Allomyces macrogynus ATCC 38327]